MCGKKTTGWWFSTGTRFIPEKGKNGRVTTSFEAHYKDVSFGIDYRPLTQNVGLVGSLQIVHETKILPAVVLGTGPDQFGSTDSQAYFATLSKSFKLDALGRLSVAPFAGVGYIEKLEDVNGIGGIVLRKGKASSIFYHNGYKPHLVLSYDLKDKHTLSFVLWGMEQPGFSYTYRF